MLQSRDLIVHAWNKIFFTFKRAFNTCKCCWNSFVTHSVLSVHIWNRSKKLWEQGIISYWEHFGPKHENVTFNLWYFLLLTFGSKRVPYFRVFPFFWWCFCSLPERQKSSLAWLWLTCVVSGEMTIQRTVSQRGSSSITSPLGGVTWGFSSTTTASLVPPGTPWWWTTEPGSYFFCLLIWRRIFLHRRLFSIQGLFRLES